MLEYGIEMKYNCLRKIVFGKDPGNIYLLSENHIALQAHMFAQFACKRLLGGHLHLMDNLNHPELNVSNALSQLLHQYPLAMNLEL